MKLIQIRLPDAVEEQCEVMGIDFGTTNSLVAYCDGSSVKVFMDDCGNTMIKSVVGYKNGEFAVGIDGVACIKRFFGANDNETSINCDGVELSPVEVGAKIFTHLRNIAEKGLGKKITKAVVTVPAYYNDIARQFTKRAAEIAGIEIVRLISEPTAAAYAYGIDKKYEGAYCVYDFGGGTFDASVVSMKQGHLRVLATQGDLSLGGNDIDRDIAIKAFASDEEMARAQEIKESLSNGLHTDLMTADEFEAICHPYVEKTIEILDQAIKESGVKNIQGILLVGGSTRLPLVKKRLAFKGVPLYDDMNPDESVVYGAALRAYAISLQSSSLLLDVTPLSLGLETMNGRVEKIIHRNTPIPISATQTFTTYADGQTSVLFSICQGESDILNNNAILAKFTLSGLRAAPAGSVKIKVTFFIDADGVLHVTAEDEDTGARHTVEVSPYHNLAKKEVVDLLKN